jgi:hypothetical protein
MISICIGIFLFDIRTMEGILFLNIFVPTIQFFMYSVYNLRKVFSIR